MPKMISFHEFLPQNKCQQGFTLLEMLLVIALMGMLALSATALVDNLDEQERFETTRTRLQQIKTAIIGDTSRTLNGEPMISGFVADMGRLPANIEELVELPSAGNEWGEDVLDYQGVSDVKIVKISLYGGSRGPYLDVLPSSGTSAVRAFRDGWGNPDEVGKASDFGWNVSAVSPVFSIQSYGSDAALGGTGVYEADYPSTINLIELDDYQVNLSGVSVHVNFNQAPAADRTPLRLRIYSLQDGVLQTPYESNSFTHGASSVAPTVATFPAVNKSLLLGKHAILITCYDGDDTPATVTSDKVYDGDCDGNNLHTSPYYFNLLPRSQLPTIPWIITP
ncbi:MAG: type II secretion system protein [Methylotenera sp.]|nr:type II secretion system protein [Methylotenera sp.]